MIKIREIIISGTDYSLDTIIGYDGEHKITNLNIKLPPELISDDIDHYTVEFQTQNGDVISSGNIQQNGGYVIVSPWQDVMVFGQLKFQVSAWAMTGDTIDKIAKSPVITRLVGESVDGDAVLLDENVGGLMAELQELIANYPVTMGSFTAGDSWNFELEDGLLNITYVLAVDGVDGDDGITPETGENGNWFMDGVDTGILADASLIDLSDYELQSNKVTSIDVNSTDEEYPSAKLLYSELLSKLSAAYPEVPTQSSFLRDDGVFAEVATFDNADVLEKFDENDDGNPTFNGNPISGVNVAEYDDLLGIDTNEYLIIANILNDLTIESNPFKKTALQQASCRFYVNETPTFPTGGIDYALYSLLKNGLSAATVEYYEALPQADENNIQAWVISDTATGYTYFYTTGFHVEGDAVPSGWLCVDGEGEVVIPVVLPVFDEYTFLVSNPTGQKINPYWDLILTQYNKETALVVADWQFINEAGLYVMNGEKVWQSPSEGKIDKTSIVTAIDAESTDDEVPSAKAVYAFTPDLSGYLQGAYPAEPGANDFLNADGTFKEVASIPTMTEYDTVLTLNNGNYWTTTASKEFALPTPTSGKVNTFDLDLTVANAAHAITWDAAVEWAGAVAHVFGAGHHIVSGQYSPVASKWVLVASSAGVPA